MEKKKLVVFTGAGVSADNTIEQKDDRKRERHGRQYAPPQTCMEKRPPYGGVETESAQIESHRSSP